MQLDFNNLKVLVKNDHEDNSFKKNQTISLKEKLYCNEAINTQSVVCIPNALKKSQWQKSYWAEKGLIAYLGVPLIHPSGDIFGTLCLLDFRELHFEEKYIRLLMKFKTLIEQQMEFLYFKNVLLHEKEHELNQKKITIQNLINVSGQLNSELRKNLSLNFEKNIIPIIKDLKEYIKNKPTEKILKKKIQILDFHINYMTSEFSNMMLDLHSKLTQQEFKIANMLRAGLSSKEISIDLKCSINTINNHIQNIRKKLNIHKKKISLKKYLSSL